MHGPLPVLTVLGYMQYPKFNVFGAPVEQVKALVGSKVSAMPNVLGGKLARAALALNELHDLVGTLDMRDFPGMSLASSTAPRVDTPPTTQRSLETPPMQPPSQDVDPTGSELVSWWRSSGLAVSKVLSAWGLGPFVSGILWAMGMMVRWLSFAMHVFVVLCVASSMLPPSPSQQSTMPPSSAPINVSETG